MAIPLVENLLLCYIGVLLLREARMGKQDIDNIVGKPWYKDCGFWVVNGIFVIALALTAIIVRLVDKEMSTASFVTFIWHSILGYCGIVAIYIQIRKMARNSTVIHLWNKRVKSLEIDRACHEIGDSWKHLINYMKVNKHRVDNGILMGKAPKRYFWR